MSSNEERNKGHSHLVVQVKLHLDVQFWWCLLCLPIFVSEFRLLYTFSKINGK